MLSDSCEYGETECLLRLPDSYSEQGEKTPLVFIAHGSGERVCRAEGKIGGVKYADELLAAGYAAFDIHGTRPDGRSYGNRRYVEAVHRAYRYLISHFNLDPALFVSGVSMGGVCAMNYVNLHPNTVRAVGLFYPRLTLTTVTVNGVDYWGPWSSDKLKEGCPLQEIVSEQYGFSDYRVFEPEKTVGLDPWHNRTVVIDGVRYATLPCPVKIWHGNADTSVQYDLSVEYIAALRRSGCYAELRTLDGRGHQTNDTMRRELLLWFDRFR